MMSEQERGSPVVSVAMPTLAEGSEADFVMADWVQVASYKFWNWESDMWVSFVNVYRQPIPERPGEWRTRISVRDCQLGNTCVPPAFPHGLVKAVVHTSTGGFFDTGTMAVHSSGGEKTADFDLQVGGDFATCELSRQTWCEW